MIVLANAMGYVLQKFVSILSFILMGYSALVSSCYNLDEVEAFGNPE